MTTYAVGCLLSCLLTLIVVKQQKNKDKYLILKSLFATLPLMYIASVRYNVGMDYPVYKDGFDLIAAGRHVKIFETLYHKLNEAVVFCGGDFRWLFAVTAIMFMVLIGIRILKDSPYPVLSIFLLVGTTYYFSFMNVMRQMIACAILMYALKYVWERKFLKFMAIVAIASGFHATSWIFAVVYFVYNIKFTWKLSVVFSVAIFIAAPHIAPLLNHLMSLSKYEHYLTSVYADKDQGYITLAIMILLAVFSSMYYDREDKKFQLYYKLQIISVWLSILIPYVALINRIRLMFGIPIIILLPLTINKIKDIPLRRIAIFAIVVLYTIYCGYNLKVYNTNTVLPYQTIFEQEF